MYSTHLPSKQQTTIAERLTDTQIADLWSFRNTLATTSPKAKGKAK